MSDKIAGAKLQEKAAQGGALAKLIAFSVALGVAPIGSYFLSLNTLYAGNTTYAAITAIVAANIVLVSYIIVAILEDSSSSKIAQVGMQFEDKKLR